MRAHVSQCRTDTTVWTRPCSWYHVRAQARQWPVCQRRHPGSHQRRLQQPVVINGAPKEVQRHTHKARPQQWWANVAQRLVGRQSGWDAQQRHLSTSTVQ